MTGKVAQPVPTVRKATIVLAAAVVDVDVVGDVVASLMASVPATSARRNRQSTVPTRPANRAIPMVRASHVAADGAAVRADHAAKTLAAAKRRTTI